MNISLVSPKSQYLEVLDVSNILYVETSVSDRLKDRRTISCKGVNIAGISEIINHIAMNYQQNRRTVLCLDSFSDKKNSSTGYKANRIFHPEIAVQAEIIEKYFPKFGVEVLKTPGLEADDLMYSVVHGSINDFMHIDVFTGDSDIYGILISPRVHITGTSSRTPSFDINTYAQLCNSKTVVPYNCALPHKVFYGKASNNIGVLKLSKPKDYYFQGFIKWLEQSDFSQSQGSEQGVFNHFLLSCLEDTNDFVKMTTEEVGLAFARTDLIYPRISNISVPNEAPPIDVDALLQFLQFYNQHVAARLFGLTNYVNTMSVGKEYDTFIRRMYSITKTGTYRSDNHLGGDEPPLAKTTAEFMSVEEW